MAAPALLIKDLCTSFGAQHVLIDLNLQLARGETLVVLGRSGTGKSVLLRHLIGLQWPDSGSIQVLGQDLAGLGEEPLNALRLKVGFVFQNAALYDSLTIAENVAFPLRYHTALQSRERRARALELLDGVGMADAADKLPTEISGGMKKRAGLARALALAPELMLYDEPTAGLDPITSGEITDLILSLHAERAMSSVLVTHDLQLARACSDRVALLDEGRLAYEGPYAGLAACPNPVAALFLKKGQA